MAVQTSNLIQGPATLYIAPFGAAETGLTPVTGTPTTPWVDLGGTTDGVTLTLEQEYAELAVDQVVDRVGSRITSRNFTIATNLAEATLENLKIALNGGTITSATGTKTYEPASVLSSAEPAYQALVIDGQAPNGKRRRIIVRKVLNVDTVEFAYNKEDQTVFSVSFTAHFISDSVKMFSIVDEFAA